MCQVGFNPNDQILPPLFDPINPNSPNYNIYIADYEKQYSMINKQLFHHYQIAPQSFREIWEVPCSICENFSTLENPPALNVRIMATQAHGLR